MVTLTKNVKDYLKGELIALCAIFILILILAVSLLCATGCAVTPVVNERETIAYEGGEKNAGILQDFEDHSSEITPNARDRYNNLILKEKGLAEYFKRKDFGISPMGDGNFRITAEAKEYWYSLKLKSEELK